MMVSSVSMSIDVPWPRGHKAGSKATLIVKLPTGSTPHTPTGWTLVHRASDDKTQRYVYTRTAQSEHERAPVIVVTGCGPMTASMTIDNHAALIAEVRAALERAECSGERIKILQAIADGWCTLCGDRAPCYCRPAYDV